MNRNAILLRTIRLSGLVFGFALVLLALLQAAFIYPVYHALPEHPAAAAKLAEATRVAFWLFTAFIAVVGLAFWLWTKEVCRMARAVEEQQAEAL